MWCRRKGHDRDHHQRPISRWQDNGIDAVTAVRFVVSQFDYGTYIDMDGKTAEQVVVEICEAIAAEAIGGHGED